MKKAARIGAAFFISYFAIRLVGGRKHFRLQQLHGLVAALYFAVTGLDAQHFAATVLTLKTLA